MLDEPASGVFSMRGASRLILMSTFIACTAMPALASVTFSDSTFTNANYANTLYTSGASALISSSAGQDASGNPGPAYKALVTINAPDASGVLAIAKNTSFVYNPGLQGAISSIDFSLDRYAKFTAFDAAGLPTELGIGNYTLRLVAEQGGTLYQSVATFGPFGQPGGFWNPLSQTGLLASDFTKLTSTNYATGGGATGLDFATGQITFGFAMRGGFAANVGTFQYDLRADNFVVTVNNAVPEPTAWVMMIAGMGLTGAAMRRRTRTRAHA